METVKKIVFFNETDWQKYCSSYIAIEFISNKGNNYSYHPPFEWKDLKEADNVVNFIKYIKNHIGHHSEHLTPINPDTVLNQLFNECPDYKNKIHPKSNN